MAEKEQGLVAELEAGLRGNESTVSLLRKCLMLGGRVGSDRLRDWARQELKGYDNRETLPEYRRVPAAVCVDAAVPGGLVKGQQISPMALPDYAREHITEIAALTNPVGELEDIGAQEETTARFAPPHTQDLVLLLNHEKVFNGEITRLYWSVSRSTVRSIVMAVRTALAEFIGELLAAASKEDQRPSKDVVDDALGFAVHGNHNTVTVINSQSATQGDAAITINGGSPAPLPEDGWWQRWRKRGLLIGLATVVGGVAAVLQWTGWTPWN